MITKSMKLGLVLIPIVAASLFAMAGWHAWGYETQPPCAGPTNESVSVKVFHPNGTTLVVDQVPWIDNCTIALAMQNAKHINHNLVYDTSYTCPWGNFVTNIDGFFEGGDHYWALYVNGAFAQKGMDTQLLKAGDKVEWKVQDATTHSAQERMTHQGQSAGMRLKQRLDVIARANVRK